MSAHVTEVTDQTFETEVLNADKPVLVDFWAEWCGPCKALAPTVEAVASEHAQKIKVCKVDVDASPNSAAKFGIRSIPTVMLFSKGKRLDQVIGNVPKGALLELLKKAG